MAPRKTTPLAERFARYVQTTDDLFSCWLWTGKHRRTKWPYGQIHEGPQSSRQLYAHRVAWVLAYGPIPDGLLVLHRCDVPNCVRPDHLFLGTSRDNTQDMLAKGRSATIGSKHHYAHFTEAQIREIRLSSDTVGALAKRWGVPHPTISDIRRRRTWKQVV